MLHDAWNHGHNSSSLHKISWFRNNYIYISTCIFHICIFLYLVNITSNKNVQLMSYSNNVDYSFSNWVKSFSTSADQHLTHTMTSNQYQYTLRAADIEHLGPLHWAWRIKCQADIFNDLFPEVHPVFCCRVCHFHLGPPRRFGETVTLSCFRRLSDHVLPRC